MMLCFDPEQHRYTLDGVVIPGTTEVLKEAGFTYAYYREHDGDFGRVGHEVIHLRMQERLESYDPQFEPWMNGIERFIQEQAPEPILLEAILHKGGASAYAGTVDFGGKIRRWPKNNCLLDWKFWGAYSKTVHATAGLQLAGYADLAKEYLRHPRRAVVHFMPYSYRIYECTDPADINYFKSALNCWWWRAKH